MNRRKEPGVPLNATLETAARWLDRRSDAGWTSADEAAFQTWLMEDPARRGAYAQVAGMWNDPALSAALGAMVDATEPPRRTLAPFIAAGAALAACVAGFVIFAAIEGGRPITPYALAAASAPGLHKTVSLPDGSTLHLNAGAAVEVAFAADARRVRMQSGEAFFEVAQDAQRPFVITTQQGVISVTGTRFNVDAFSDGVEVTVAEGGVAVQSRDGETVTVAAGHRVAVVQGRLGNLRPVHPSAAEAWRTGWLETDGMPLSRLVERLAREGGMPVFSIEPALQKLEIAGRFKTDNPAALLKDLGAIHGFVVRETAQGLRLERA